MNLNDDDIIMIERTNGTVYAWIVRGGDEEASMEPLPPTDAALRISPMGFGYGYSGSGPAALAHSILAACCGEADADAWHQDYKWQHQRGNLRLVGEPTTRWTVKVGTVREWIDHQKRHVNSAK